MQKQELPKSIAGFLTGNHTDILQKTNRLHDVLTNLRYEGKASFGRNLKEIRGVLDFFNQELTQHVRLEEEVLFPFLEAHVPKLESVIRLLKAEHEDFKKNLKDFEFSLNEITNDHPDSNRTKTIEQMGERGLYLVYLLRNHIQAEAESVYKVIDQELRTSEKKELEKRFGKTNTHTEAPQK